MYQLVFVVAGMSSPTPEQQQMMKRVLSATLGVTESQIVGFSVANIYISAQQRAAESGLLAASFRGRRLQTSVSVSAVVAVPATSTLGSQSPSGIASSYATALSAKVGVPLSVNLASMTNTTPTLAPTFAPSGPPAVAAGGSSDADAPSGAVYGSAAAVAIGAAVLVITCYQYNAVWHKRVAPGPGPGAVNHFQFQPQSQSQAHAAAGAAAAAAAAAAEFQYPWPGLGPRSASSKISPFDAPPGGASGRAVIGSDYGQTPPHSFARPSEHPDLSAAGSGKAQAAQSSKGEALLPADVLQFPFSYPDAQALALADSRNHDHNGESWKILGQASLRLPEHVSEELNPVTPL